MHFQQVDMRSEVFNKRKICIIGYSGHSYVVIETLQLQGFEVVAYCDVNEKSFNPYSLTYLGPETESGVIEILTSEDYFYFVGIGNNNARKKVFERMEGKRLPGLVARHPLAIISSTSTIGISSYIAPGAIIQAQVVIGNGVICNTACVIEHECIIDDFAHIAPSAVLCGNVHVGEASFVGAGAVINQGIKIGTGAIIGSGAVVIKDVPDNCVVVGNPAREINVTI